ncbi:serine threonine protein kinase [Diplodia corticola]|uniref:Serine threonine protein kinase n=1 Tax=Diplodia corticola TaxID=236234 RepID=A0A1J9QSV4_9PEZI|nr:serine threonine protein kinase [Diplodia corticola]OJD32038.1 serine threonine protein kinase [Diplodia corticola]
MNRPELSNDKVQPLPGFPDLKTRHVNGTYEFVGERQTGLTGSGHVKTSRMSLLEYITNGRSPQWHQERFDDVLLNHLVIRSSSSTNKPIREGDWIDPYNPSCTIMAAKHRDRNNFPNDWIAVKIVRLHGTEKDTNEAKKRFMHEIRNMQTLSADRHHHIISFIGSYESGQEMGIAMFPVAKYSLELLLKNVSDHNWENRDKLDGFSHHHHFWALLRYFLCLSSAVAWLHSRNTKHKDIKPANILIDCKQSIVLADFGLSRIYDNREDAGISSGQTGYTMTYAPPEVIDQTDRTYSADLFSLACVFLEMATVICGEPTEKYTKRLKHRTTPQGARPKCYASSPEVVRDWVEDLKKKREKVHPAAERLLTHGLERVKIMMSKEAHARGEAKDAYECFKSVVESAYAFGPVSKLTCERCTSIDSLLPPENQHERSPTVPENHAESSHQATHALHNTAHPSSAFTSSTIVATPLGTPILEKPCMKGLVERQAIKPLSLGAKVDITDNPETGGHTSEALNSSEPSRTGRGLEVPSPSDVTYNPSSISERTTTSGSPSNQSTPPSSISMRDGASTGTPQQESLRCVKRNRGQFYQTTSLLKDLPGQKVIVWDVKKKTTEIQDKDYLLDYKRGVLFISDWRKRETVQIKHLNDRSLNLFTLLSVVKIFRCWREKIQLLLIVSERSEERYKDYLES